MNEVSMYVCHYVNSKGAGGMGLQEGAGRFENPFRKLICTVWRWKTFPLAIGSKAPNYLLK